MLQYHEMLMSVHDALRSASIRVRYFAQVTPTLTLTLTLTQPYSPNDAPPPRMSIYIRVHYAAQAQPGRKEPPKWDRELPSLLVAKRVQLGARIGAVILATSALVHGQNGHLICSSSGLGGCALSVHTREERPIASDPLEMM